MARLARVVVPGLPHHVTQRGNHREAVFFGAADYRAYLALVASAAKASGTEVWAYCLMPNHVHFIMTPSHPDGLRATFAEAHRRYSARIHARLKLTGHLWQGRFSSTPMDERHLIAAARYIAMNPVVDGLVKRARDWKWASTRAHLARVDDGVVVTGPILARVENFAGMLKGVEDEAAVRALLSSRTTGRPVGAAEWIKALEVETRRGLAAGKRGPKAKDVDVRSAAVDLIHTVRL